MVVESQSVQIEIAALLATASKIEFQCFTQ